MLLRLSGFAMAGSKTLYRILNVSPDADPVVIEAAFRALMKKYHPDRLSGEQPAGEDRATELNNAFRILRDPEQRARYDAEERSRYDGRRSALAAAPNSAPPRFGDPPRRRRWPQLIALLAVATVGTAAWWEFGSEAEALARARLADLKKAAGGERSRAIDAPVDPSKVERAVSLAARIRTTSGLLGVSGYSQDCFGAKGRELSLSDFDFCVAFDQAASSSDNGLASVYALPRLPRFEPQSMMARHQAEARRYSDDEAWIDNRLAQIQLATTAVMEAPRTAPALETKAPAGAPRSVQAPSGIAGPPPRTSPAPRP